MRVLRGNLVLRQGEDLPDGTRSWTLFDPVSDKYFRLSEKERLILESLVRDMSPTEALELAKAKGVNADIGEILSLDAFLSRNRLYVPALDSSASVAAKRKVSLWLKLASSLFFFRIPLFRPEPFIAIVWERFLRRISVRAWCIAWLVSLAGYIMLLPRWHVVVSEAALSLSVGGMLKYIVCAAVLKALHEFAHAFAAKAANIDVRRMGVAFIVFFPRFYTDITDAWRVSARRTRALIDAAGILFEFFIGGFAALLWSVSPPGPVHSVSYYVVAVTVVNTLFVNGNPFIRYDGYYLLSDLINIDNLRAKANAVFLGTLRSWLWGIPAPRASVEGWRKSFLAIYSVMSFAYRVFLYTSIVAIIYFKFTKTIGLALACVEAYVLIVLPVQTEVRAVMGVKGKKRGNMAVTVALVALSVFVLVVPLPWTITFPCELVSPESFEITTMDGGLVDKESPAMCVGNVGRGDIVVEMSNRELKAEWRKSVLETKKAVEELRRAEWDIGVPGDVRVMRGRIKLLEEVERARFERVARLALKAGIPGRLYLFDWKAGPREWVGPGVVVGEVYNPSKLSAIGYVPERWIGKISAGDTAIAVPSGALSGIKGRVVFVASSPSAELSPSPVLSPFGGRIAAVRTPEGKWRPVERLYPVIVELKGGEREFSLLEGRSGVLRIKERSSIIFELLKWFVSLSRGA